MVKGSTRQAVIVESAAEGVERAILILSGSPGETPLRSEEDLLRLAESLAREYASPPPEKRPRRITPDNLIWLLLGGAAVAAAWVASGLL